MDHVANDLASQNCDDFFPSGGIMIECRTVFVVDGADGGGVDCCFHVFFSLFWKFFLADETSGHKMSVCR